jgi:uncharacterized membrane protein
MLQKIRNYGLYKISAYILISLTSIAFLLILTGFALGISQTDSLQNNIPFTEIITGIISFNPASLMAAGIGILFIIPIMLLVTAVIIFFLVKDRVLFWIALLVIVFLSISAYLALS